MTCSTGALFVTELAHSQQAARTDDSFQKVLAAPELKWIQE